MRSSVARKPATPEHLATKKRKYNSPELVEKKGIESREVGVLATVARHFQGENAFSERTLHFRSASPVRSSPSSQRREALARRDGRDEVVVARRDVRKRDRVPDQERRILSGSAE